MGNDLHPYYPRRVIQTEWTQHGQYQVGNGPSSFSDPSPVLEIPVSWYLDDFPAAEYVTGIQEGMTAVEHIESRWRSIFDYAAAENHPSADDRPGTHGANARTADRAHEGKRRAFHDAHRGR